MTIALVKIFIQFRKALMEGYATRLEAICMTMVVHDRRHKSINVQI